MSSIDEVTKEAVLKAIAEYDELGRSAFLEAHNFGEARSYFLVFNGKEYDSKAIVGVAYGHLPGKQPLTPGDFSGGEATVKRLLNDLGFEVRQIKDPPWTWDELVLACDVVADNNWRGMSAQDERVIQLSALLQTLPIHPRSVRSGKFRNPNGVGRKTADIATHHPNYTGKPTNGGKLDLVVLHEFLNRPDQMHEEAKAIRAAADAGTFGVLPDPEQADTDVDGSAEGRLFLRLHSARERNASLRGKKIKAALAQHGCLKCEVCNFDFEHTYGDRGKGYTECHHVTPLHVSGEVTTRLADLAILCANCHRMIHRGITFLTPAELRSIVRARLEHPRD